MKVFIYCGVSGSGKSTLIGRIHPGAIVCSADSYFMGPSRVTPDRMEYRFNPSELPLAHGSCLRHFVDALASPERGVVHRDIIVDNTNTTIAEIAPYAALALAYGAGLEIRTIQCDPNVAHSRNAHGVPLAAIVAMADRLGARVMPPWWKHVWLRQVDLDSVPGTDPRGSV